MPVPIAELFISVGADISGATSQLNQLNAQLNRVGSNATGGGGFSNLSKNLRSAGSQAKTVGADLTATLTAPLLAIGGAALGAGLNFEHSFTQVRRTVDGLDDTQLQQLRTDLIEMSKGPAGGLKTASELAEIAATGGQLGLTGDEIKTFTSLVARLSLATNLPFGAIADDVGRSLKVMNLAEKDYEHFGDAVAALGNEMGGTEADIFEFSKRLAGTLTALGVKPQQILAISAALSEAGVNPEAGGTAINKFFVEMVNSLNDTSGASEETKQKLQALKDTISDLSGNLQVATLRQSEFGRNTPASVVKANQIAIDKYQRELGQANTKLDDFSASSATGKLSISGMAKVAGIGEDAFRALVKTDPAQAFAAFVAGLQKINKEGGPEALTKTLEDLGITEALQRQTLLNLASSEKSLTKALDVGNKAWDDQGALATEVGKAYEDPINKIKDLSNKMEADLIVAFDKNREAIDKTIAKLGELSDKFSDFVSKLPALTPEQIGLFAVLAGLGPVVFTLGTILQVLAGILAIAGAPVAAGLLLTLIGLPIAFDQIANHWEDVKSRMDAVPQLKGPAVLIDFFKKNGVDIKLALVDIKNEFENLPNALGASLNAAGKIFVAFGEFLSTFFDTVLLPILLRFKGWIAEHILGALIGLLQGLQKLGITTLPGIGDIGQTIGNLQGQQADASAAAAGGDVTVTINNPQVTSQDLLDKLAKQVSNAVTTAMVTAERSVVIAPQPLPGQVPGTPF